MKSPKGARASSITGLNREPIEKMTCCFGGNQPCIRQREIKSKSNKASTRFEQENIEKEVMQ